MSASDEKIVNQENKNSADLMTWREYEALCNEMRCEFRTQDDELRGTVQGISQNLDATNATVTTMRDQMTDIQRSLSFALAVENLTQQQQQEDEDPELQDEAHNARGAPRGNRPRGFAELRRPGRGFEEEDGLGKPKFSIPKFEGGADVEEYLTWEKFGAYITKLKIERSSLLILNLMVMHCVGGIDIQGVKTVDEYYMEMEMLMQRGRVKESLEMTMTRFLNGLKYDIKDIVRHYSYTTMNELLHHAREAESQLVDEAKVKGRALGAGRFMPRAPPPAAPAPSTRSAPYSTPPSKPVFNVSNTKKSESAASTSGSNMSTTRNRDMACHTCGGKGHFKRDCSNRKVIIINEDNEYETGDDADPNAPEDDDYDTDGEDAYPSDARTIVVSQRALNVLPSASTQRCNLFQTKALVGRQGLQGMKREQASHEERGAAGPEDGREAGHGAGHEDISWTREGAGGMREEKMLSGPVPDRSDRPCRRTIRSRVRSDPPGPSGPNQMWRLCQPGAIQYARKPRPVTTRCQVRFEPYRPVPDPVDRPPDQPWKGFSPDGALDGIDLSAPSEERTRSLRQEINYLVAHSLHRHSLVNTLERVALRVIQEIMRHQYSPSGPALGTHQGELPLQSRPPLPFALAAPEVPNSPAFVVYKIGGDPSDCQFLHEAPKEIPHGYMCTYVPDCGNWALTNQATTSGTRENGRNVGDILKRRG
ncbi:hypothetical protein QYE76_063859 [Lolium multiflorum]|uniref:CCHC-type domain-containing protein n=1 Tax=Lolium multiflorum TaxID=4521 RepID=A0AAD8W9I5_LOLMU|nr:hypothetical protein QYE76_063859 [Lolium multiflorum]